MRRSKSLSISIWFYVSQGYCVIVGDRLTDQEVDEILKFTNTEEDLDGNIKYGGERENNFC